MNVIEYDLIGCELVKSKPKLKQELKPELKSEIKIKIDDKTINYVKNKSIILKVVNENITDNLNISKDTNEIIDVLLDITNMDYIINGFKGETYNKLDDKTANLSVITHYKQFQNNTNFTLGKKQLYIDISDENEYKLNEKLDVVKNGTYKLKTKSKPIIKLIHVIEPNFNSFLILENLLYSDDIKDIILLNKLFYNIYFCIFKEFKKLYDKNKNLKLRLLPISSTLLKSKIYKAIHLALSKLLLEPEFNFQDVIMFIKSSNEYELYKNTIKDNS